jgi:hypothetical protein
MGNRMKTFARLTLALSFLLALTHCGNPNPNNVPSGVAPNYVGSGYAVYVEQMALNTYKFTVTSNEDHKGAVFTVYGLTDSSQITTFNTSTRMRLAHIADGNTPGDTFEVTFNSDDTVFIIYEDVVSGGSFVYDKTKEMIRGQFR